MKNIITVIAILKTPLLFSQIIIGDEIGTATDKTSVLLEFSKTDNKGIILPYVKKLPTTPTEGTLVLDSATPTKARVKYYNGEWVDLTNNDDYVGDITSALSNQPVKIESAESKVIIGANTSEAEGVLVLESKNKAMVLPTVNSYDEIINPAPGMIVYLKDAKMFAVYNGNRWSYWGSKP